MSEENTSRYIIDSHKINLVTRRHLIDLAQVEKIVEKEWNEIKEIVEDDLRNRGFLRSDSMANALIEEARTRASIIVKDQLGEDVPELVEKIAKYIIAFTVVDRSVEEVDSIYIYNSLKIDESKIY